VTPIRLERNISKTTRARANLVRTLYRECLTGGQIIFPESGRSLGHVTPTIFGIRSNISLKLLELETSNLIHGFVWAGRGLGHVTPTIFGSMVGYPSDSLASCSQHLQAIMPSLISTYTMHQFDYHSFSIVITNPMTLWQINATF